MYYKDTQNNLHFLEHDGFEHLLPYGASLISDEEADELRILSMKSTLSNALSALASKYKADLQILQSGYVAALLSDGPTEESKKLDIAADAADRKAQYLLDVAACKASYQP